jgi:hypothetical protein
MKNINGIKMKKNGWTYISIYGDSYDRGYAHGYLLSDEIKKLIDTLSFSLEDAHGLKFGFFLDVIEYLFLPKIKRNYEEFYNEMRGICDGANTKGKKIKLIEIILINNYASLDYALPKIQLYLDKMPKLKRDYGDIIDKLDLSTGLEGGGSRDRCTAFIAVGDYTKDGKICCSHNSFDNFIDGQYFNVIVDLKPSKGNRILYQSYPGCMSSQTDFFITSNGFIGTETTIGGFLHYENRDPISCRIRKCMQYAQSLDDYEKFLQHENSGDYANSWLIGDTNTNTIMRIELGLNFVNVSRKTNGYFIGFNAPYDERIRNLECQNTGFDDIRRHQGARKVRLEQLLEKHKGKVNVEVAKKIISDHYDVYLEKENPCSRTCCSHYDLDNRAFMSQSDRPLPYQPRGAVDGAVCDTTMCKNMSMLMRYGNSCGTPFIAEDFFKKHIQWKRYAPFIIDRPRQPWTVFSMKTTMNNKHKKTKKHGNRENTKNKNNTRKK